MTSATPETLRIVQRVTLIGMVLDLALGVTKILVGIFGHSQALIADGVHSISDAVTDVFVLVISRISTSGPDAEHPYGHGRFETLGTMLLGGSLVGVAAVLAYDNVSGLLEGESSAVPGAATLVVALVSVMSKEWIFQYTRRAGEALRSNLLIANAWHSRTDALSSVVVIAGIAGAMVGIGWLDHAAAIIVALLVARIGFKFMWDSLSELVDTGLDREQIAGIRKVILTTEGVRSTHEVRTRHMGAEVYLDLHITVSPEISVSEGHQIGVWVTRRLLEQFDNISDVTYHIDPEDDDKQRAPPLHALLPLRKEVLQRLGDCWAGILSATELASANLHYLDKQISVELFLSTATLERNGMSTAELEKQLNVATSEIDWLERVKVWVGND